MNNDENKKVVITTQTQQVVVSHPEVKKIESTTINEHLSMNQEFMDKNQQKRKMITIGLIILGVLVGLFIIVKIFQKINDDYYETNYPSTTTENLVQTQARSTTTMESVEVQTNAVTTTTSVMVVTQERR